MLICTTPYFEGMRDGSWNLYYLENVDNIGWPLSNRKTLNKKVRLGQNIKISGFWSPRPLPQRVCIFSFLFFFFFWGGGGGGVGSGGYKLMSNCSQNWTFSHRGMNVCPICPACLSHHVLCVQEIWTSSCITSFTAWQKIFFNNVSPNRFWSQHTVWAENGDFFGGLNQFTSRMLFFSGALVRIYFQWKFKKNF